MRLDIKAETARRNIEFLCHFTRIENVSDIARDGLISRDELNKIGRDGIFNDGDRHDRQEGAICCSVSYPNYKVFFPFRCKISCAGWVVVILKPDVLWEKECAFSVENAASSNVSDMPIKNRIGVDAFKAMFDEWPGGASRKALGVSDEYTTNPQAEVLVGETIEPHYFLGFATSNQPDADQINTRLGEISAVCAPWCFDLRRDWEYWR